MISDLRIELVIGVSVITKWGVIEVIAPEKHELKEIISEYFSDLSFSNGQMVFLEALSQQRDMLVAISGVHARSACLKIGAIMSDDLTLIISSDIEVMNASVMDLVRKKYRLPI